MYFAHKLGVQIDTKQKSRRSETLYMDGLVSTGKRVSLHNIKKTFNLYKNFFEQFY